MAGRGPQAWCVQLSGGRRGCSLKTPLRVQLMRASTAPPFQGQMLKEELRLLFQMPCTEQRTPMVPPVALGAEDTDGSPFPAGLCCSRLPCLRGPTSSRRTSAKEKPPASACSLLLQSRELLVPPGRWLARLVSFGSRARRCLAGGSVKPDLKDT